MNDHKKSTRYSKMSEEAKQKDMARSRDYREKNKDLISKKAAEWYKGNREKVIANRMVRYFNNKEKEDEYRKEYGKTDKQKIKNKAYREKNKVSHAAYSKRYFKKNKERDRGSRNAILAKYRATKLQATPPWLTEEQLEEIRQLYVLAKEFDEDVHVDHIEPLQGKNSCGLHVPWNLQLLTAHDNLSKGNRLNKC